MFDRKESQDSLDSIGSSTPTKINLSLKKKLLRKKYKPLPYELVTLQRFQQVPQGKSDASLCYDKSIYTTQIKTPQALGNPKKLAFEVDSLSYMGGTEDLSLSDSCSKQHNIRNTNSLKDECLDEILSEKAFHSLLKYDDDLRNQSLKSVNLKDSQQRLAQDDSIVDANHVLKEIKQRILFHPFADKQPPIHEWKLASVIAMQTLIQFIFFDIMCQMIKVLFKAICFVLLLIALILALGIESLHKIMKRFKSNHIIQFFDELKSSKQVDNQFTIVVELKALVSLEYKPNSPSVFKIRLRPYLEYFLGQLQKYGEIIVFTTLDQAAADQVIASIKHLKNIKQRFYDYVNNVSIQTQ